jgi:hypothetical protein
MRDRPCPAKRGKVGRQPLEPYGISIYTTKFGR